MVKKRIGESKRDGPFPRRRVPCYSLLAIASAALLLESVQPGRVVYQDLAQQRHVTVDVAVKKLDFLRVVHHSLGSLRMRPVGPPDGAVGCRLDECLPIRKRIVPARVHLRIAIAVGHHHPPILPLQHVEDPTDYRPV